MMLEIADLRVSYGDHTVLNDVALNVPKGSLVAVLGPSGCGKTTLLRAVAGFLHADSGTVKVGGKTVVDHSTFVPPERRGIGYVPQEGALFPHLDVAGNIAFGLGRHKTERVNELLALVGLAGFAHRKPHELSGGQQQRVALARALAPSPSLVLLDEPFAALDMTTRMEVRDDVRRVLRATGATAVLVTHDRDEALGWADLVAVVESGRVIQVGTPVEVYLRPTELAVARSVGETVEVPAIAKNVDGKVVAISALGETPVFPGTPEGPGTLMLRPSQFRLAGHADQGVSGIVTTAAFTGEHTEVSVLLAEGITLHAHLREPGGLVVGATARLSTTGMGVLLPASVKDTPR